MASSGKVSINSEEVSNALTYIVNSCAVIEGDISSKIPGSFQALADLGFFATGLNKIQEQVKSVINVHKDLISQISSHLESVAQTETELSTQFRNGGNNYSGYNNYYGGGSSGSSTDVDGVVDGQKINAQQLIEFIPQLDDDSKTNLVRFINVKKEEGTSFVDLLFNTSKSEELFVLINKALGDNVDLSNLTINDYIEVQKTLLEMICANEIDCKELNQNTILIAKEYLNNMAKANNYKVSDLLIDPDYRNTLKTMLINLYDGDVKNNSASTEEIENFRNYIDRVALANNLTYEKLLSEKIELIL